MTPAPQRPEEGIDPMNTKRRPAPRPFLDPTAGHAPVRPTRPVDRNDPTGNEPAAQNGEGSELAGLSIRDVPRALRNELSFAAAWAKRHGDSISKNDLMKRGLALAIEELYAKHGRPPRE